MAQQDLKELGLTPVKPLGADKGPDSGNLR